MAVGKANGAFHPSRSQIELIAECQIARLPPAAIAERLGINLASFTAWTDRLAAARDYEPPMESHEEFLRKLREQYPDRSEREPKSRLRAERMF